MGSTSNWEIHSRDVSSTIVLTPVEGALETFVVRRGRRAPAEVAARDAGLRIELKGNLAAMSAAQNATRSLDTGDLELQIAMIAGAGKHCVYRGEPLLVECPVGSTTGSFRRNGRKRLPEHSAGSRVSADTLH